MDPDPNPDPSLNVPTSEKSLKNFDFNYFVTSFGLFSWKYEVNVTLKSNKQKNFEIFFIGFSSAADEKAGSGSGSVSQCY